MTDSVMRRETDAAGAAVARLLAGRPAILDLAARIRTQPPRLVVVCGRGSSAHAGTYLRYQIARRTGLIAAPAMPAIASVYGRGQNMAGTLFLAVSQSGRSPDLVAQAERAGADGALTVALVNEPTSPLARACHAVIDLAAGPEHSVAATKSVIAAAAAGLALLAAWTGDRALDDALDRLPTRLDQAGTCDWSRLTDMLGRCDRMLVVGRGHGLGIAKEVALKLAETCGIAALAFSTAELMHGPVALAGPGMPVFGLLQNDESAPGAAAVLATLAQTGVPVLAAGAPAPETAGGPCLLPTLAPDHPDTDPLTLLSAFYRAAEAACRARGRDPDHPPGLSKITETR